ncbi:MAG: hypothetical protein GX074_02360 [Erysipelothrix sp.]|nr:hypothetical protein [Erysipelothrix sp.]
MKKILIGLMVLILLVACGKEDYGLGVYGDKQYTNDNFNIKLDITDKFSYLTDKELKAYNESVLAASQSPDHDKYFNKVMDLSNTNDTSLVAYVDSRPKVYKNSLAELNNYLDFLTQQSINYALKTSTHTLNGVEYDRADLTLDFGYKQTVLIAVKGDYLLNVQVNYSEGNEEDLDKLLVMLNNNE